MNRKIVSAALGLTVVLASGIAMQSHVRGQNEATVRLPSFVVKSGGTVMGPVITMDQSGDVVVGLTDPDFGNTVPLMFRSFGLQGSDPRVQYDGLNCTGTAYVAKASSSTSQTVALLGKAYGVGQGTGGDLMIFRGDDSTIAQPTIQSMWINGGCNSPASIFGTVTNATEIISITNDFPGPYTLE